jgi:hypothetical protein
MSVISVTREVEIRRIAIQGQIRQNIRETPSQPKIGHDSSHCNPNYKGGWSELFLLLLLLLNLTGPNWSP